MWFMDQPGPTPDPLNGNLHFNKIPVINTYIKVWEMLLERRVQSQPPTSMNLKWFNPWCDLRVCWEGTPGQTWTPVPITYSFAFGSISASGSFIIKFTCSWERWRFFSALILPCVSWDTRKVKQRRCWREKAKRVRGLGERVEWRRCLHLTVLPQSRFPSGSFLGSSWSGLSMSAQAFHQGALHPRLMAQSPKSTCSPSSISSHWFFLPLSSRRKGYVIHVPGFVLPLCSTFQNFPLWLILTGSPLSIHPHFMARYATRNAKENVLGPLADPPRFTLVHLKSGPFHLHLHSMSIFWSFVSPESSSVYHHLTSFWNDLDQHSLGINE